jgi:PAS domain S-box-containing protein
MNQQALAPTRPVSVLLVDDHEENLLALEVTLSLPGVTLVKASSGADALRAILRETFAVILLDVSMPEMDGFEVARLIKRRVASRHIPIVFVTAAIKDVESIYRGDDVGAVDYILKPIDADVVRAKVAVFVELYRRGEEIAHQTEQLREAERRRREAEIAELRGSTDRRYHRLADAIPQLVWTADASGAFTYFNRRWVDYTGYTLAQSLGVGWPSVVHPDDAQRFVDQWESALRAGTPSRFECRLRRAQGGYRWHLCEILPEHDQQERVCGWLGTFTDLDEHKRMEDERQRVLVREQAARSEAESAVQRLEFLAEASGLLTRSLDATGILHGLAALAAPRLASWCVVDIVRDGGAIEQVAFGHEDPTMLGASADLARRLPTAVDAAFGVAAVIRSRRPETSSCDPVTLAAALGIADVEAVRRLGAAAYLTVPLCARDQVLGALTLVTSAPARTFDPSDIALVVDIGQRAALAVENARLYAAAQQAIRVREEFLSIASHELRTPLSALELQVQSFQIQIAKKTIDVPRVAAKAAVIRRQVDRLARLISEMLDVSRIDAGRLELTIDDVDLGDLVREVGARFAGELERAATTLTLALDAGVVGQWDRLRLDQVVTNLLHNAIKYGKGAPIHVALDVDPASRTARLTVTDHGIGISAKDQPRIFGRFERAVSSRAYGGMGVGLFIVAQIIAAHHAEITVDSALGEGATFTVKLPMAGASALSEAPASAPSEQHSRADEPRSGQIPNAPFEPPPRD